jgi:hypothetical protein
VRRARGLVAALLAGLGGAGCGLVTLAHDSAIGPVSPLGRIHETAVGSEFHVTERGPVAELGDDARLRPYPRDLFERVGAPHSFWSLAQGIQAFIASISPLTSRETRSGFLGAPPARALAPGTSLDEALARLGPPDLWVARESESLLFYRAGHRRTLAFYLGVPPPAAALIPIPGLGNLYLRWSRESERAEKLLLFFDREGRLVEASESREP